VNLGAGLLKWTLRQSLRPGDIGYLTSLHGIIYAREYGYDTTFEAYVAGGIADFIQSFKPGKDRIWVAQANHRIVGSIAIVYRPKGKAQLRWFFVHPRYRGHGIGKGLLKEALRFSKRRKYKSVFLWTTGELDAALHLYTDLGFKKTQEKKHRIWGQRVKEERYDLRL
jgi:ribosomal protein S18 acetylase RimI-like enzyme